MTATLQPASRTTHTLFRARAQANELPICVLIDGLEKMNGEAGAGGSHLPRFEVHPLLDRDVEDFMSSEDLSKLAGA